MSQSIDSILGKSVFIKRSNGDMQEATVSKVIATNNEVVLEWKHEATTYAKQVLVEHLIKWNPGLFQITSTNQSSETDVEKTETKISNSQISSEANLRPRRIPRYTTACDEIKSNIPQYHHQHHLRSKVEIEKKPSSTHSQSTKKEIKVQTNSKSDKVESAQEYVLTENTKENIKPRKTVGITGIERKGKSIVSSGLDFEAMIEEYRDRITITPLQNNSPSSQSQPLIVCVRRRPLNPKEISRNETDIITIPDPSTILVHECKFKIDMSKYIETSKFNFDFVFDQNCSNRTVFNFTTKPLVECMFSNGMATCFAYGQTGSGKTFTMVGNDKTKSDDHHPHSEAVIAGLYEMTAFEIFSHFSTKRLRNSRITVNFFEVYMDKIFDLLNNRKQLKVMEDSSNHVQVYDLKVVPVHSPEEVMDILRQGLKNRTSGKTSANSFSSRSHAIFQFNLQNLTHPRRKEWDTIGRFSLVDLAGNERGADIGASSAETRKEGSEINKSLLALKECIRALLRKSSHVPFRSSKLTHILQESFMAANAKTCMIATISPGINSSEHSMDTLRYADRLRSSVVVERRNDAETNFVDCSPQPDHSNIPIKPDKRTRLVCTYEDDNASPRKPPEEHRAEIRNEIGQILFLHGNSSDPKIKSLLKELSESKITPEDCIDELCRMIEENIRLYSLLKERVSSLQQKLKFEEKHCLKPPPKVLRKC